MIIKICLININLITLSLTENILLKNECEMRIFECCFRKYIFNNQTYKRLQAFNFYVVMKLFQKVLLETHTRSHAYENKQIILFFISSLHMK